MYGSEFVDSRNISLANNENNRYNTSYQLNDDGYSEYISTSSHGSGKECYKLQTTTYPASTGNILDL